MEEKNKIFPVEPVDLMIFGGLLCGGAGVWELWGIGWALLAVGAAANLLGLLTELIRAFLAARLPKGRASS